MNENDFDDGLKQLLVCAYGVDCARATKERYGDAAAIYDALKAARNKRHLNRSLYVIRTGCQGWCEYASVCAVSPEGRVYRDVLPVEADAFVEAVLSDKENGFEKKRIWNFSKSRQENLRHLGK